MSTSAFEIPRLVFAGVSTGVVNIRRFVKCNADGTYSQAGAAEMAIGVSRVETADGETLEIGNGILIVEAGAAVTAGTEVESDAAGRAITKAAGIVNGVALTNAAAAGEFVAVKL